MTEMSQNCLHFIFLSDLRTSRMDIEYRIRIQKFFVHLYESIDVKETSLLDRLYQQNVLTSDEVERIRKEVTKQDANKKLLVFLIRCGPAAFDVFLKCLRQAQNGVEDLIRLVTETPIDVENESVVPCEFVSTKNKLFIFHCILG